MRPISKSKACENICIAPWTRRAILLTYGTSAKRDCKAAARFFRKVLKGQHTQAPRVITVDKNVAYPVAMDKKVALIAAGWSSCVISVSSGSSPAF
jgi:transposase-like protein